MDVEFIKVEWKNYEESRIILQLSQIIESNETSVIDGDYQMQAVTRVVTSYGATHLLLINFDEFKELYEKMLNKKIVIAR